MIRKAVSLLLIAALCTFLVPGGLALADGPAIATEYPTYDKGEEILITGSGFPVGTAVTLTFLKDGNTVAIVPQLQYGPSFTCSYTTGVGWEYGEYQIRATYTGGGPVYTSFTLAPKGKLVTDKDNYFRGATVSVEGSEFPFGPAITLSVIKDSTTVYILPSLFYGPSFSATFNVGSDWAYGTYYVRATYIGSETKTVLSNPFEVVPVPPIPSGLTAIAGHNQVSLSWNPVDNPYQDHYKLYRAQSGSGPWDLLGTPTETSYLDTTALAYDGSYYYQVFSVDKYGNESAGSNIVSATPWGDLDSLRFDEISSPQVAGVPFAVTVTALDAFGHTVADHETPLMLSDSTGTLSPVLFGMVHGVGTHDVTITKAQTGVVIHAVGSPTEGNSNPFDVVHNPNVNHLVLAPKEETVKSGEDVAYTLTAYDDWNNEWNVTTDPGTTYEIEEGAQGSWAANVYTACKAGTWEVTASYGGKSDTATLIVEPGPADHIVLNPLEATNQVGETHQLTAQLLDACENPIEGAKLTFVVSGTHNEGPVDILTDQNGTALFEYTETTPGIDSIMVTYLPEPAGTPIVATATKVWVPGPVAEIVLTQESDANVVGTPHNVVATAYDFFGNPVPDAEITFVVSGDHEFAGTEVTDENGVAVFTYTVTYPVGVDEIQATYLPQPAGIPIYSNTLTKTWLPGPPAEIVLTQAHDTNTVGDDHVLTATVKDQYGNFVADGTAVNFVVDRAGKSGTANTTGGVATYSYTVTNMAGDNTDSIYATCLPEPPGLPVYSNTLTKTWLPGDPSEIVLTQNSGTNTVGQDHVLTATVKDQYGNPVADGTVVNFVVDRAGKSGTANTTGGVATYTYTVTYMAGDNTDSISATCGNATSNTLTKTWLPGDPTSFAWNNISSPQVAGVAFPVAITAYDQYGNACTNFTGTANLSASNGGITPAVTGNFVAGVWTGSVTVEKPGNGVKLTAQNSTGSGISNAFDVYWKDVFSFTQGWNLISLNVVTNSNPLTVFAGLPSGWRLYAWDPVNRVYLDKNHATIIPGQGYWVWLPAATSYTVTGPINTAGEIQLSLSWNLIGNPFYYAVSWNDVLVKKGTETVSLSQAVANGWVRSTVYYWQGGAYLTVPSGGTFQPLVGYWFYAKVSGCTLIFPTPTF